MELYEIHGTNELGNRIIKFTGILYWDRDGTIFFQTNVKEILLTWTKKIEFCL